MQAPDPTTVGHILASYGPLAAIAGGAWAVLQQVYRFAWRLASVERASADNAKAIAQVHAPVQELVAAVGRIEGHLEAQRTASPRGAR